MSKRIEPDLFPGVSGEHGYTVYGETGAPEGRLEPDLFPDPISGERGYTLGRPDGRNAYGAISAASLSVRREARASFLGFVVFLLVYVLGVVLVWQPLGFSSASGVEWVVYAVAGFFAYAFTQGWLFTPVGHAIMWAWKQIR